jgi:magnesium transporter
VRVSPSSEHLHEPILRYARTDFPLLAQHLTVQQALDFIRVQGVGERIIYFYVVDEERRLVGVLPTRRLLVSPAEVPLRDIMLTRVVAIPDTATVLVACEMFVLHKYFAFPIVDEQRRIIGVVDVSLFREEVLESADGGQTDDIFETIGFHIAEVRGASPLQAFRYRFPWLLATIASGTICALLAGAFEVTLAESLILAFFLTLVLGLGESVSVQSMAVTLQALHVTRPSMRWYLEALRRELSTAALLGVTCGSVVMLIAWLWRGSFLSAMVIGGSILLSLLMACLLGLSIPSAIHRLRLDPKIAAGPVTLALTDICTLLFYLTLGSLFLRQS